MTKVITRFTISSDLDDNVNILEKELIKPPQMLRKKGEPILLADGHNSGRSSARTVCMYTYEFLEVTDIEICNDAFIKEWIEEKLLKNLIASGFKLELNYEITIYDYNYPSFYFKPHFLTMLSDLNIEFSLYFYTN